MTTIANNDMERQQITFHCKDCDGVIMASVWPMKINLDESEGMKDVCELLNDGYIPVVAEMQKNNFNWCKCNIDNP